MELATGMPDDAPSTSVEVTTAADPARLWSLVVDPSTPAAFSEEFVGADWLPTDGVEPPGLGARFVGRNERGDRSWETTCTVTAFEQGRCFGWTVEDLADPVSSWTLELLDAPKDGTTLRFTARMGPSPISGLNRAIRKHPDRAQEYTQERLAALAASMQRTVEGIATLATG